MLETIFEENNEVQKLVASKADDFTKYDCERRICVVGESGAMGGLWSW